MSMYNIMFGYNPAGEVIIATLGLSMQDVPRFRDCHVSSGEIAIYTRMGGNNYECWGPSSEGDVSCDCSYCIGVLKNMEGHPNYLRGENDEFDSTYRTFYFSFPEKYKVGLTSLSAQVDWDPDARWAELLHALNSKGGKDDK